MGPLQKLLTVLALGFMVGCGMIVVRGQNPIELLRRALNEGVVLNGCSAVYQSWHDPGATHPWTGDLKQHWRTVRDELHAWEHKQAGPPPAFTALDEIQRMIAPHKQWRTLWLRVYGEDTLVATDFPKTLGLLPAGKALSVMFSVLGPGDGLELHRGDVNAVLRYHLALEVPPLSAPEADEPLALMVADKLLYRRGEKVRYDKHEWAEGKDMLFDDTYMHFVINERTTGRRVVLFMDLPRHDCNWLTGQFLSFVTRYIMPHVPRIRSLIDNINDNWRLMSYSK